MDSKVYVVITDSCEYKFHRPQPAKNLQETLNKVGSKCVLVEKIEKPCPKNS